MCNRSTAWGSSSSPGYINMSSHERLSKPDLTTIMDRLEQLVSQLTPGSTKGLEALQAKSPDDVVITMAIRSPMCKAKKGGLKDTK